MYKYIICLMIILLCCISCHNKITIGEFDIGFGTGSNMWCIDARHDELNRREEWH